MCRLTPLCFTLPCISNDQQFTGRNITPDHRSHGSVLHEVSSVSINVIKTSFTAAPPGFLRSSERCLLLQAAEEPAASCVTAPGRRAGGFRGLGDLPRAGQWISGHTQRWREILSLFPPPSERWSQSQAGRKLMHFWSLLLCFSLFCEAL